MVSSDGTVANGPEEMTHNSNPPKCDQSCKYVDRDFNARGKDPPIEC